MKKIIISLYTLCLLLGIRTANAQSDMTLYNMNFVHTRLNLNPALRPQAKFNLGLPGLGSTAISFTNSGFAYRDLIHKRDKDDSLVLDMQKMLGKLKPKNFMSVGMKFQLFDLGFKIGAGYVRLSVQERVDFKLSYTKDLFNFLINGNGPTMGKEQNLGMGFDMMHFREYALGYSHQITDQITAGITLKYLYGMENIQTAKSDVILYTDPNTYELSARSDVLINTSGIDSAIGDAGNNTGKYLFGKKNKGFAADFGITYKPHKRWMISASLLDVGSIKWKDDLTKIESEHPNKPFKYGGININDFLNDSTTVGNAFGDVGDSLKNSFGIKSHKSTEAYKTKLARQMFIGANYFIGEKTSIGALFHGQFYDKKLYSSIGLNASTGIGRFMNLSASYTVTNSSYANVGVGMAVNLGPLQFHAMTDNLLAITQPLAARNVHARFGIYFTFGRKASDRDGDGITDFKDACPDDAGLREFDGCPDTDKDGIMDLQDSCPSEAGPEFWHGCPDMDNDSIIDKLDSCAQDSGLKEFNGCPDGDRDGIINKLDSCPARAGLEKFNGCPDTDGDGIMDRMDRCPEVAGLEKFNGCPDRDGDGVEDSRDDCPDTVGLAQFNGCPDTDGDGIADKMDPCPTVAGPMYAMGCPDTDKDSLADAVDGCPTEAGPRATNGCPDTDGDGLIDRLDKCPTIFGVLANNGCPELKAEEQAILTAAFDNLEFAVGKDVIAKESMKSLNDLAALLKKNPSWKLQIDGHTDNVGNAVKNTALSTKRANAVKRYLTSKGVAATRLTAKGYGSSKPVADNSTAEGRDRNRRVEMTVIY